MTTSPAAGSKIIPIYLLIDVSWSMAGEKMQAANEIVPALLDACRQYMMLADLLRFCVISFSDEARTVIPMGPFTGSDVVPAFKPENGTSYSAAFDAVSDQIDTDVAQLKADGFRVTRPSIFFITDGDPTDDETERIRAWNRLVDPARTAHPNVITFGVGHDVTVDTLKQYKAHKGTAFKTKDSSSAVEGLRSIIEMLVQSVVGTASGGGEGGLVLPPAAVVEDLEEI